MHGKVDPSGPSFELAAALLVLLLEHEGSNPPGDLLTWASRVVDDAEGPLAAPDSVLRCAIFAEAMRAGGKARKGRSAELLERLSRSALDGAKARDRTPTADILEEIGDATKATLRHVIGPGQGTNLRAAGERALAGAAALLALAARLSEIEQATLLLASQREVGRRIGEPGAN